MRLSCVRVIAVLLFGARTLAAQEAAPPGANDVQALRQAMAAMQTQLTETRREADALRHKLDALEAQLEALQRGPGPGGAPPQDQDLLSAKVQEHEQTKVASGSKYRMRLSGFVLVNLIGTLGTVDSLDLPRLAVPETEQGSFGAGVRQSNVTLEVFGAELGGAKTSGDLSFDFFGGFPVTALGATEPLVRLKTARVLFDWKHTSLLMGQETPFFSPRSPSSLMGTAYPAMSSSGNLWAWTPQVRLEHRVALGVGSTMSLQAGLLDALTGELPEEYARIATSGERTGLPAEAVRVGIQRAFGERTLDVGGGGYYSRQSWSGQDITAWAATADWDVPLGSVLAVSGELYHGNALAGLGGGAASSVIVASPLLDVVHVQAVRSTGGWIQLKAIATPRLSFNAAYGADRPSTPNRNETALLNAIYQARSNLLLSLEYRRLRTTSLDDVRYLAHHISFTTGIGF
jgi:hypothetical protein